MRQGALVIVWLMCVPLLSWGQQRAAQDNRMPQLYTTKSFSGHALSAEEPVSAAQQWLSRSFGGQYNLVAHRESLLGHHLLFEQYVAGYPVAMSSLKINLDATFHITSYFATIAQVQQWNTGRLQHTLSSLQPEKLKPAAQYHFPGTIQHTRKVIYVIDSLTQPLAAVSFVTLQADGATQKFWLDEKGQLLGHMDLRAFHLQSTDTTVQIQVFQPDPLTSAGVQYGGLYSDINDAESPSLNDELIQTTIRAEKRGAETHLSNNQIKMVDRSAPNIAPPTSGNGTFLYTRGNDLFEFANAYYHMTSFVDYCTALGFGAVLPWILEVDPHGTTQDNSFFTPAQTPYIIFGTGGVDDAEDADVVVHELGHAISHALSPNTNTGFERKALDEGFGDYLAASYSRAFSSFRWGEVYTWDGHNEYWNGRFANQSKTYPNDLGNSIYLGGEIWSSALMEAWPLLGRENMDRLAIQVMYSTAANMTLRDAARLLLQAESQLYNGQYQQALFDILYARGLIETFETAIVNTEEFLRGTTTPTVYLSPEEEGATVTVYDLHGRMTGSRAMENFVFALPEHWFPSAGMYLVELTLPGRRIVNKAITVSP